MRYIASLLVFLFISSVESADYIMTKSTFSNAGGSSSSANYILKDAAGQSVTGQSEDIDYIEQAGFYTYSKRTEVGTQEPDIAPIPRVFSLSHPYPNPIVKSEITVRYGVPRLAKVSIKVYDVTGRTVRTLIAGEQKAGFYNLKWDGKSDHGNKLSQGIYFIRMIAQDFRATKKLVLLK
ncbi:T9SS type A sorting domain-containing protein [candidate division WOR-3 bacterium]|nr:T9SS type A sorting domain-containing protein [candidate division WOR-3 bacterium]